MPSKLYDYIQADYQLRHPHLSHFTNFNKLYQDTFIQLVFCTDLADYSSLKRTDVKTNAISLMAQIIYDAKFKEKFISVYKILDHVSLEDGKSHYECANHLRELIAFIKNHEQYGKLIPFLTKSDKEVIKEKISYNISTLEADYSDLLFQATCLFAEKQNEIILKKIIATTKNFPKNKDGYTPIKFLAKQGKEQAVNFLLLFGMNHLGWKFIDDAIAGYCEGNYNKEVKSLLPNRFDSYFYLGAVYNYSYRGNIKSAREMLQDAARQNINYLEFLISPFFNGYMHGNFLSNPNIALEILAWANCLEDDDIAKTFTQIIKQDNNLTFKVKDITIFAKKISGAMKTESNFDFDKALSIEKNKFNSDEEKLYQLIFDKKDVVKQNADQPENKNIISSNSSTLYNQNNNQTFLAQFANSKDSDLLSRIEDMFRIPRIG